MSLTKAQKLLLEFVNAGKEVRVTVWGAYSNGSFAWRKKTVNALVDAGLVHVTDDNLLVQGRSRRSNPRSTHA